MRPPNATPSHSPKRSAASRIAALNAIASPARQELRSAIGEGPATVHELSQRLGRSRQALYYHLNALEKAGLIRVRGTRGEGRDKERIYETVVGSTDLRVGRLSRRELDAAARATASMLRLTQREILEAVKDVDCTSQTKPPAMLALRAKARLDAKSLEKLHALLREITQLFRAAKGKNADQRLFAITMVLTPARESASVNAHPPR